MIRVQELHRHHPLADRQEDAITMIPADPSHAPWCRAILIPCRICQLGFELITIGLLALAVGVLVHDDNDNSYDSHSTEDKGGVERAGKMLVIRPVWLSLISTCLILTTTEITLLARKRLKPLPFLITNILESTIRAVLFVIEIVSAVDAPSSRTASALAIMIEALRYVPCDSLHRRRLSFWLPLISSIIYRRFRRGTQYRSVYNA
ncbi:hypothetical protein PZA11_006810 [Diplocarpon coronariae]